jgi:hypothetical protein
MSRTGSKLKHVGIIFVPASVMLPLLVVLFPGGHMRKFNYGQLGYFVNPAPVVTLQTSATSIAKDQAVTLSWSSLNAKRVELRSPERTISVDEGTASGDRQGSVIVTPDRSTTYSITASGPGGTGTNSVTIEVETSPHCSDCARQGPQEKPRNIPKPKKSKYTPAAV